MVLDGVDEKWISFRQWFQVPSNVKLLFSADFFDDNSLWADDLGYPLILIDEISREAKQTFIKMYLQQYGKEMEKDKEEYLAQNFTGNISMLRSLLNILVTFGNYETIKKLIDKFSLSNEEFWDIEKNDYLLFPDKHKQKIFHEEKRFYKAILNLYEKSFPEIPVMELLASIHYTSLRESEIAEFTHISPLHWSIFKASFSQFLTHRANGYIKINNTDFVHALNSQFIYYKNIDLAIYERAINFFGEENSPRRHNARILYAEKKENYDLLFETLCDTDLFTCLYSYDCQGLSYYWNELILKIPDKKALYTFGEQLIEKQRNDDEYIKLLYDFTCFCIDPMGNGEIALLVANKALSICEGQEGDKHDLNRSINQLIAKSLIMTGDYAKAIQVFDTTISNYNARRIENDEVAKCYCYKALAHSIIHQNEESLSCILQAKEIIIKTHFPSYNTKIMAFCFLFEGIVYLFQKNKRAIVSLECSLSIIYENYGYSIYHVMLGDIWLAISYYFYQVSKHDEAYRNAWCTAMAEYTGELHDNNVRFAIAHLIGGMILYKAKQFEGAKEYLEGACEILNHNGIATPLQKVIEKQLYCVIEDINKNV